MSLLGSTMIHEFVHTPQGGGADPITGTINEAKPYGVEMFFAERMGDQRRATKISDMGWDTALNMRTGAYRIFNESYRTMKELYRIIDQGGPAAKDARAMTVEFISKNQEDYSRQLREFISTHRN